MPGCAVIRAKKGIARVEAINQGGTAEVRLSSYWSEKAFFVWLDLEKGEVRLVTQKTMDQEIAAIRERALAAIGAAGDGKALEEARRSSFWGRKGS